MAVKSADTVVPVVDASSDRLLTHYFRYVMREESGPLRDRLQRGLVERALKTGNQEHTMTGANIQANVEKLTGVKKYPRELVNQSLNQLVPRGYVEKAGRTKSGDELYRLSPGRFGILEGALERVAQQEQAFRGVVTDKIEAAQGQLAPEERERVERAFLDLVSMILGKIGERCALNLVEEKHWKATSEYPRFQRDLEQAVKTLPNELQDDARRAFEEALQTPTPEQGDYLYSVGQVYYMVELLHLDPELQTLQRARFEETRLFLDTNLLLAVLLPEIDRHDVVLALLRLCRNLGFHLSYSERTVEELESLIDTADDEYKNHPPFSHEMASELALAVASPFLRAYFVSWPEHKWSWAQFRARASGWRDLLEREGISLDDACPRTMNGQRFEHLKSKLGTEPYEPNGGRRTAKRPRAIEHDAHMLAAVEGLVLKDEAEAHPFGHRFWFLTLDRRLAERARASSRSDIGPVCMLAEEWLQYISPFLGPDVSHEEAADVFARLLGSRFFVSLGAGLDLEDLQPFTAPNVKEFFAGLTQEEACRVVAQAAQSEAVAAAEKSKRPAIALDRLMGLVDERLREKQTQGELIPKGEVERLRAEHERDRAQIVESASEKDERIDTLERELSRTRTELATTHRQVRWSPVYQFGRFKGWLLARRAWAKARRKRLLVVGIVFAVAVSVQVENWGGIALPIVSWLALLVAAVAADPEIVKKNVRRTLPPGSS